MESVNRLLTKRKFGEGKAHLEGAEANATFNWLTDFDVANLRRRNKNFMTTNISQAQWSICCNNKEFLD
jgi:hypothetical protein